MAWTVVFAAEAERDFGLIFDHLFESYRGFGEPDDEAFAHAATRVRAIRRAAERLAHAPHSGTRRDDLVPGLRHVTLERAIFWFQLDEAARRIVVLVVFFGSQDHVRRMLVRLF